MTPESRDRQSLCFHRRARIADSVIIVGLHEKCAEISGTIAEYQRRIAKAQTDLRHLDATIKPFKAKPDTAARTLGPALLFEPGGCLHMTLDIMREAGIAMSSRQIALEIIKRKGLESNFPMIYTDRRSITTRCCPPMHQSRRLFVVADVRSKINCGR
jgi:hypothetical protein